MRSLSRLRCTLLGIVLLIAACTQHPVPVAQVQPIQTVQAPVEPNVSFGYVGNQYMAHITDQTGQTYLMDYNTFTQLMGNGGYNAVSQYYYQNPTGIHIHTWSSTGWHSSYTADATQYGSAFRNSYHSVQVTHHVYVPTTTQVQHVTVVHHVTQTVPTAPATPTPISKPEVKAGTGGKEYVMGAAKSAPTQSSMSVTKTTVTKTTHTVSLSKSAHRR